MTSQIKSILESVEVAITDTGSVEVKVDADDIIEDAEVIVDPEVTLEEDTFEDLDEEDQVVVESMKSRLRKRMESRSTAKGSKNKKATKVVESNNSRKLRIRSKRVVESLEDRDEEDLTVNICPICGGKDFNAEDNTCPICGEGTDQYIAKDPEDVDTASSDGYTSIEVDGKDKILIDDEGNTAIAEPDIVNDVLELGTHELVVDGDDGEEPISVDSGVATFVGDEPITESEDPTVTEDTTKMAFLRISEPINDVAELLMEDNANRVDKRDDDNGIILTATLDGDVVEEVVEGDEPEVDGDVVNNNETVEVELELEELPNGTLIHIPEVEEVADLVDIVNELLPDDVNIETSTDTTEEDEVEVEDTVDLPEEDEALECNNPKVLESGMIQIRRNGKLESFKCRTVRNTAKVESASTVIAGKDRKVSDKGTVSTATDETDMKKQSVLEKRSACKESARARDILEKLGVPKKTLESAEGIKLVSELVKCCGNIKEYKSGVSPVNGQTITLESTQPRKIRSTKTK